MIVTNLFFEPECRRWPLGIIGQKLFHINLPSTVASDEVELTES